MLRNIVVGVDGSSSGRRALEWAVASAADEVHAVHATSPAQELLAAVFQFDTAPLIARLTTQLEEVWTVGIEPGRTKVFTHLVEDSPVSALSSIAGACNADAIAVGSRGVSSSSKMVGATTSRLTHLSDLPTVVVPNIAQVGNHDEPQVTVIGVTGNPGEDAELVRWASLAARDSHTRLDLVNSHAAPNLGARQAYTQACDGGDASPANPIDDWLARQHYSNPCRLVVIAADPITALLDASEQASLIVVGSHRSSRLAAYLTGALANHLPTVSRCPVAIVPLPGTRP